jgi:ankyrin repeat protein
VEAVDGKGQTALHHAAYSACYKENEDAAVAVTELLLQRGARVDARGRDGAAPLHWAARCRYFAVMRLLLDHGAEVDARADGARTPLMALFEGVGDFTEPSAAEGVQLLAGRGADAGAGDSDGRSVLSHACAHPRTDADTVRALLAGARIGRDDGPLLIGEVLAAAADDEDETPLNLGAIDALIAAGARVSLGNARALAEAAARFDADDPEQASGLVSAIPRLLAAAERTLGEDVDARVASSLAAAVDADRRDVASGLRALITGAAAEARAAAAERRRLEAARAALAEERRAAAAEREALAQERQAAASERAEPRRLFDAPDGSGGGDTKPLAKRARRG